MEYGKAWTEGLASTDSGSPADPRLIVGNGTQWTTVAMEGDLFWSSGYNTPIAEVVDDTHLILRLPWPGPDLSDAEYSIEFLSGLRHDPTQLAAHVLDTINRLRVFDVASPLFSVNQFGVNAPPGGAVVGDLYVIGNAPTGAFSGHNNEVAEKTETGWLFRTPQHGWHVIDQVSNFVRSWTGTDWSSAAGLGTSVTFANAWNSSDDYDEGNVVTHNDEVWIAIAGNSNSEPSAASDDWDLFLPVAIDAGLRYQFLSDQTNSDPGSGNLKLNGAQGAASTLRISRYDRFGNDWGAVIAGIATASTSTIKGRLWLVTKGEAGRRWSSRVSDATAVDGGAYYNLAISSPAVAAAALQGADEVLFQFVERGDVGQTGSQGIQGLRGHPGGGRSITYVVDANLQADSDPGNGVLRFGSATQSAAVVLRVDLLNALGSDVSGQLDSLATASTSAIKANARLFDPNDPSKEIAADITGIEVKSGYRNISITIKGSSAANPFAHSSAITLSWVEKGDKGDAATVAVGAVTTGAAGSSAAVANAGTANAAVLNFTIPRGDQGENFEPQYVVPLIADRDDHDAGPVLDANGRRLSVLVESDSTNDNLPTLYFLLSTDDSDPPNAVWSEGFTFGVANLEAVDISFDGTDSGLVAGDVQGAIDEAVNLVHGLPNAAAMAMIFGGGDDTPSETAEAPASVRRTSSPFYAQTLGWEYVSAKENYITIGGFSIFCRYGFGSIWVGRVDTSQVIRVNPETGQIVATIAIGTAPGNAVNHLCATDEFLFVSDPVGGNIYRVDPDDNSAAVFTSGLGAPLRGLAFDGEALWSVGGTTSGVCRKIDLSTGAVVATVAVGNTPYYPAFDGEDHIWVPNFGANTVSRVHKTSHVVSSALSTIGPPWGCFADGGFMYVSEYVNPGTGSIVSFSIGANANTRRWTTSANDGLHDLVIVDDELWCTQSAADKIVVLDMHSGTIKKQISVGTDPAGICFDGKDIWQVDAFSHPTVANSVLRRFSRKTSY